MEAADTCPLVTPGGCPQSTAESNVNIVCIKSSFIITSKLDYVDIVVLSQTK